MLDMRLTKLTHARFTTEWRGAGGINLWSRGKYVLLLIKLVKHINYHLLKKLEQQWHNNPGFGFRHIRETLHGLPQQLAEIDMICFLQLVAHLFRVGLEDGP